MAVKPRALSKWLLDRPEGRDPAALERIRLAMTRLPNVLDENVVANLRTLEQKISDQGPKDKRVNPHLLRLALLEIVNERKQIIAVERGRNKINWYANAGHDKEEVNNKLDILVPIYERIAHGNFPNLIGDALEIVVFRCIEQACLEDPRCSYLGSIEYEGEIDSNGRYKKHDPASRFMQGVSHGPVDFIFTSPDAGPLLIECKNVREWIYPNDNKIKDLLKKSCITGATPCLIARRIHYSTISNLFEPAGIIAHESYFQYYPEGEDDLISKVSHKRSLGFSDVRSWRNPHSRTNTFFQKNLKEVGIGMAVKFRKNRDVLRAFADGEIKRAELYRAIGSPAAGFYNGEDLPDGI